MVDTDTDTATASTTQGHAPASAQSSRCVDDAVASTHLDDKRFGPHEEGRA